MRRRPPDTALAAIALLGAWIGVAIFVAAVIAPAAFAVLPTRALAGALVGRILPDLFIGGVVLGGILTALWSTRVRIASIGALLLLAGNTAALMIERRLHTLLLSMGTPIEALSVRDPRRIMFGRLHGISVLMMGVGVIGASIALVALARWIGANTPMAANAVAARSDV